MTLYQAEGLLWMQILDPLKTPRPKPSEAPPPTFRKVLETSGNFMAVGGEGARERVLRENAERVGVWREWEGEQEREQGPKRPMLLDAPPIGCPDHPNGRFEECGPCGTARRRHDRWVAQEKYTDALRRSGSDE